MARAYTFLSSAALLCAAMCLEGCSSGPRQPAPLIEFSRIPEANPGGQETQDIIEGFVNGARPGEQIVLYSRSGQWWVQPLATHPFTKLAFQAGRMKWTNATHLGTDYAALLVEPGYRPAPVVANLPKLGGPSRQRAAGHRDYQRSPVAAVENHRVQRLPVASS